MRTDMAPGVYIQEVSSGARPIEAVGTSTAAFIGVAPDPRAHVDEPVAINNPTEFQRSFATTGAPTHLAYAVQGFFLNGGTRCYVLNLGAGGSLAGGGKLKGIAALERCDEVAIVAAPGMCSAADYESLLEHCERLEDRVAILDPPGEVDDIDRLKEVASVSAPRSRPRRAEEPAEEPATPAGGLRPRQSDRGFGAFYFPWIRVRDMQDPQQSVAIPPSGHLAGMYARTDSMRGVHKAPANESLRGALGLSYSVTRAEQATLNKLGVNCIRFFAREGIRVWGARTLASSASEWRYLNVRRLFNMIEESIMLSTRWVVFEPNDMTLWKSIRRDIGAFLTLLWRSGALMGATPEEAFFVQCDAETNPPEVIDQGMVVIQIGIAPVKPAEFVVFRIGQYAGGAVAESQ